MDFNILSTAQGHLAAQDTASDEPRFQFIHLDRRFASYHYRGKLLKRTFCEKQMRGFAFCAIHVYFDLEHNSKVLCPVCVSMRLCEYEHFSYFYTF